MSLHELSREQARRISVQAPLLGSSQPTGLVAMLRRLTLLQLDPTAAIAPNADLVAWSRLGSAYSTADLTAVREKRELIELDAILRPAEDFALYRADMAV